MDKYTRRDAEICFERLCKALKKKQGHYVKNAQGKYKPNSGAWALDCNFVYGGYVVEEIDPGRDGSTGISQPFGPHRRSARDFCQMVWDIENALRVKRGKS